MKDKIVIIDFYCKDCQDRIHGTMNSPKQWINESNNETYTEIRCPYCKKTLYIKNENGIPIKAIGKLNPDDVLTDEDNPQFKNKNKN